MGTVKAVIFDMDGLLLDTEKLLVKYWVQAANEEGFPMTRENALAIRSMHRNSAIPFLQGLFGKGFDYGKIRSRRMELMNEYLADNPLELKSGAKELLAYLKENGFLTAVATATDPERTRDYLTKVGIYDMFDKIICATMVERGKPNPDIYFYAAEQLEAAPYECIALEDSPNGVLAAASAGCKTIMIPDLTEPDAVLSSLICARLDSLGDLIDILKDNVGGIIYV